MLRWIVLFSLCTLCSCSLQREPSTTPPENLTFSSRKAATPPAPQPPRDTSAAPEVAITKPLPIEPKPSQVAPPPSKQSVREARYSSKKYQSITLHLVTFDSRKVHINVVDQTNGPGSEFLTGKQACSSINGLAAINGGFFTPSGAPLGLVFTNGTRRGTVNSSSLGSGYIYKNMTGQMRIVRRNKFPGRALEALQTGPLLIENDRVVKQLSQKNSRPRSLILWDGHHTWGIATTSSCTLAALAKALVGKTIAGQPIRHAINLDGGRSCDLYVSSVISGGPDQQRSFIAKPVRNFLVLTEK